MAGDVKAGAPGTNIDMPFLMAPMNGVGGKLAGYAYISSRVTANSDVSRHISGDPTTGAATCLMRRIW